MGSFELGFGFFELGRNAALTGEYAGRYWACYQCARPDYEMARYALDGSQNLILRAR